MNDQSPESATLRDQLEQIGVSRKSAYVVESAEVPNTPDTWDTVEIDGIVANLREVLERAEQMARRVAREASSVDLAEDSVSAVAED